MEDRDVWAPHSLHGFVRAKLIDVGGSTLTAQPLDGGPPIVASYDRVFPCEDDLSKHLDDNCALMFLNEGNLLNNLQIRFKEDIIYTYVANILIAINPCRELPSLYSTDVIKKYRGKSLGLLPPHVYAIADKAYREMRTHRQSQSIIVSGESGSGKTETTKYVIRYLTSLSATSLSNKIEERLVEANPLLESFGNAKTTRNNNSSRFGKFMEVHFNERPARGRITYEERGNTVSYDEGMVVGGSVSHYLLEKSRIVSTAANERNYHVFYRLCRSAPPSLRKKLGLLQPGDYNYLSKGVVSDPGINDEQGFQQLCVSMQRVGLSEVEQEQLFQIVAAVLHLGNISFQETDSSRGGSLVASSSSMALQQATSLLGLEKNSLNEALTTRVMTTKRGGAKGTVIGVPLKCEQAVSARDALAKAIYSHLFDHIVHRINECFPVERSASFIGVLDIAGFEYFQHNSFEQFCINYCNEKLQQLFNERMLKQEQALYEAEGLGVAHVSYVDNQDCIDLIELKKTGIIDLLDEECRLPSASFEHFTTAIHQTCKGHFRLSVPRQTKLSFYKGMRDTEGFAIRHYAGAVCYDTRQFLEKNNDALHDNLEMLMQESSDKFVRQLFPQKELSSKVGGKKLIFASIGDKFRNQLNKLILRLNSTGASFIRCVKTNFKMEPHVFMGGQVLSQLQCSGMVAVLDLMQSGYPSRTHFLSLYDMYKNVLPPKLASLQPRTFCMALFHALGLETDDFKFGLTKVFFKAGKFAEFDQIVRSDPDNLASLVERVTSWLICRMWKKAIWVTICTVKLRRKIMLRTECGLIVQKTIRGYVVRKRNLPRIKGMKKFLTLGEQLALLHQLLGVLTKYRKAEEGKVIQLESSLRAFVRKLKNEVVSQAKVDECYKQLSDQINGQVHELRKLAEKEKEEAEVERLRKIQEELERERRRKEEEERRQRQLEEERRERERQLREIEERRKKEEEARLRREEEERKRQEEEKERLRLIRQMEEEELQRRRAAEEQERRDRELAERLAQDAAKPQDVLLREAEEEHAVRTTLQAGVATPARPPAATAAAATASAVTASAATASAVAESGPRKKIDLSAWKYADLRDTINTSNDIELLEACRDEFHRRLKVYQAWKTKNRQRNATAASRTVPDSIQQEAVSSASKAAASSATTLATPIATSSATPSESVPAVQPPQAPPRTASSAGGKRMQRYFRIPFIRPSDQAQGKNAYKKKGWWYAHFDGAWIARQMELHPDRMAILLVAGVDDMEMCELSLDETGLTRKRGAEILGEDFDAEWTKHGGQPYKTT